MTPADYIAERLRIHAAAQSEGEWWIDADGVVMHHYDYGEEDLDVVEPLFVDDATAIVDAHNHTPKAWRALQKVLELHEPMSVVTSFVPVCSECEEIGGGDVPYPCPTVKAITEALGVRDE